MSFDNSDTTPNQNLPQVFAFNGIEIRVFRDSEGNPLFVAADVCKGLEIKNVSDALRRLEDDEKALVSIEGISRGNNQVNMVNKFGLYALILRSRKAGAKDFQRWVTHEVLPAIEKQGYYAVPEMQERIEVALRKQERLSYQFIRETLALATDYQEDAVRTRNIFRDIQNIIHFAATGLTAAELTLRANRYHQTMGLTNWKGKQPIKSDVLVGKNYLSARELQDESDIDHLLVAMLSEIRKEVERGNTSVRLSDLKYAVEETIRTARKRLLIREGHINPNDARVRVEREYAAWKTMNKQLSGW